MVSGLGQRARRGGKSEEIVSLSGRLLKGFVSNFVIPGMILCLSIPDRNFLARFSSKR
jgi:hypothetical protein